MRLFDFLKKFKTHKIGLSSSNINLYKVGGTKQSGLNLTDVLTDIIINISELALEDGGNLASILAQLDITQSALRDALRGASNKDFTTLETDVEAVLSQLDVVLSTRASETTLATLATEATLAAQLDITLSALRDALRGASNKDFTTLEADVVNVYNKLNAQLNITLSALRDAITDAASPKDLKDLWDDLETIKGDTPALNDDSIKGLLRSIGDAGATPTNAAGKTLLKLLTDIAGIDFATQTTIATLFKNSDLRGSSPTYGAIAVANTATLIKTANASRKSIFIQNLGSDNLYLGNNNLVTTVNAGAKVVPGFGMEFIFCTSDIYGISDGANIDTRYFEVV